MHYIYLIDTMTKQEIQDFIDRLERETPDTEAIFCFNARPILERAMIEANPDGLRLMAALLLRNSLVERSYDLALPIRDADWYEAVDEAHSINVTPQKRSEFIQNFEANTEPAFGPNAKPPGGFSFDNINMNDMPEELRGKNIKIRSVGWTGCLVALLILSSLVIGFITIVKWLFG